MSYHKAPQGPSSPDNDQDRSWISPVSSTMNFDDLGDGPHLLSNLSFNRGGPEGTRESEPYGRQHEVPCKDTDPDIAPSPNSSPHHGKFNLQDSYHNNPLGLSHQNNQSNIRRLPVVVDAESATNRPSVSDLTQMGTMSGMASPDETLVGGYSPQSVSRWGRFWRSSYKSLGHKKSSRDCLTTDMQPIDGATCPVRAEETACESDSYSPYSGCGKLPIPEILRLMLTIIQDNGLGRCSSRKDVEKRRFSAPVIAAFIFSLLSTGLSVLWLYLSIKQPRYGQHVSSDGKLSPSTATLLAAFLSKTIELTFAASYITVLGQTLTRRAISQRSGGMTLTDMSMRSWVIQPGSLVAHWTNMKHALRSSLGILTILAALVATFYTTASDAMVTPKLKFGSWEHREMSGYVRSSYANYKFMSDSCRTMLKSEDAVESPRSCSDVMVSGESYRNLQAFMGVWTDINTNGSSNNIYINDRPPGKATLNGTTTLQGSWIETEHSNVTAHFEKTGRIINNVTLAMPHPGVAFAAISPQNKILQPRHLGGVGEYSVRAGVVSPAINVLCVNMAPDELKPLIYTEWPNAKTNLTNDGKQKTGWENWTSEVPPDSDSSGKPNWRNKTVVDDIFRWGAKYERRAPFFRLYPSDYSTVIDTGLKSPDAVYILGKRPLFANYTLCELRSWVSPKCSTRFNISGISGSRMEAHCEDRSDANSYLRSFPADQAWPPPQADWKALGDQWRTASDLNGGERGSKAANSRILTQLALKTPSLPSYLPSIAEALAVFASCTLVLGSVDTPFVHFWNYSVPDNIMAAPGVLQAFQASVITQEYTSSHIHSWQAGFYSILGLMCFLNLLCLLYLIFHTKFVTDYTESQNLFSLALNSAPDDHLKGSCGGGPEKRDLAVPWRVGYSPGTNHYFIEHATGNKRWNKFTAREARNSAWNNFDRLNKKRWWQ
ncbi:hypothetical protein CCM_06743 [Cordyceps militaris CM01]|uniref:Uncharacterized protein n=1 Tax=Cordyceps militaris (strain CM01) TaxID=983644 RepID=G3JKV1_CORMM|nr:uncharacterized protein CCM_06743 [Cordyceps militaris CM01]EGX90325.1 hypothetical protein CCM_06743 [Cordyceps militaris CM01]